MSRGRFVTSGLVTDSSAVISMKAPSDAVEVYLFNHGVGQVFLYLSATCNHSGICVKPNDSVSVVVSPINSLRFQPASWDSSQPLNISYTVVTR